LGGYEGQDKNRYGFENEEEEGKANTSGSETRGILSLLGTLGLLAGGAAGIAKVMNDNKATQRQLEELKRHNRVMEGHGFYLAPYKNGQGGSMRKKNVQGTLKMPKGFTTNVQLQQQNAVQTVCAFHILEVFLCVLPRKVHQNESSIVNLDNAEGPSTQWVAYEKRGIAQYISTVLAIFDRRRN